MELPVSQAVIAWVDGAAHPSLSLVPTRHQAGSGVERPKLEARTADRLCRGTECVQFLVQYYFAENSIFVNLVDRMVRAAENNIRSNL
jgi:hypothetical protein